MFLGKKSNFKFEADKIFNSVRKYPFSVVFYTKKQPTAVLTK